MIVDLMFGVATNDNAVVVAFVGSSVQIDASGDAIVVAMENDRIITVLSTN